MDLLGPEEVDGLLQELATCDTPLSALESLSSDPHLLEELCFSPSWPTLCDSLGRLVGLALAAPPPPPPPPQPQPQPPPAPTTGLSLEEEALGPQRTGAPGEAQEEGAPAKLQRLLLGVLRELAASGATSSPPHAAELLDALAPHLEAGAGVAAGVGQGPPGAPATAPSLLAAASAADPFFVGLTRVSLQILGGLAAEFYTLPLSCATLAARAVCGVMRAGLLTSGGGTPAPAGSTATGVLTTGGSGGGGGGQAGEGGVRAGGFLSALELWTLMDPELRWWRRMCAATHGTQVLAGAAAAAAVPAAVESALATWAAVATAAGPFEGAVSATGAAGSQGLTTAAAVGVSGPAGRSPAHLVASVAVLGGLVGARNPALTGEAEGATGAGPGAGNAAGGHQQPSPVAPQPGIVRRCLAHLLTCFCALMDRGARLRLRGTGAAAATAKAAGTASGAGEGGNGGGGRGSVLLILAADVLSTAASLGLLHLATPVSTSASVGGGGGAGGVWGSAGAAAAGSSSGSGTTASPVALTPLLQALLRAAAATVAPVSPTGSAASTTATSSSSPSFSLSHPRLGDDGDRAEVEGWLLAAEAVLCAAADHAAAEASSASTAAPTEATAAITSGAGPAGHAHHAAGKSAAPSPAAVSSEAPLCPLLRHIAGRVRGCAGVGPGGGDISTAAVSLPRWTRQVVRCAVALALAPSSPAPASAIAAALADLYDTLHVVLVSRQEHYRQRDRQRRDYCDGGEVGDRSPGSLSSSLGPTLSLLDVLDGGNSSGIGDSCGGVTGITGCQAPASPPPRPLAYQSLDDAEVLAAHAILSYVIVPVGSGTAAEASPPLPSSLHRPALLRCAAAWLCRTYDTAGDVAHDVVAGAGAGGDPVGGPGRAGGGAGWAVIAGKLRAVRAAGTLAGSCEGGQRALVAAGFARRVLADVRAVLRSGEYESPYLEPLPYADPLAALTSALADVLCWRGLLREPGLEGEGEGGGGRRKMAATLEKERLEAGTAANTAAIEGGGAGGLHLHRAEVLALLQELVTWLDPSCGREGTGTGEGEGEGTLAGRSDGVMAATGRWGEASEPGAHGGGGGRVPRDAAVVVSLRCFSALVGADPRAAAALERDTNIRWYLHNLADPEPEEPQREPQVKHHKRHHTATTGGVGHGSASASTFASTSASAAAAIHTLPHADLVLDLARGLLSAMERGA